MQKIILTLFTTAIVFSGCSKKSDAAPKDNTAPDVRLLAPVGNLSYKAGEKICVTATGLDDNTITTVTARLVKEGQENVALASYSESFNKRSFELDCKLTVPAGLNGKYKVVVEAKDYYGNKGSAGIGITNE